MQRALKNPFYWASKCLNSSSTWAEPAFTRKGTILNYKHHKSNFPRDLTNLGQLQPARPQQPFFRGGSTSKKCSCVVLEHSDSPEARWPSTVPAPTPAGQNTGTAWARGVQKSPLNEIKDCTETGKKQPKQPSAKHPKSTLKVHRWESTKEEG